MENSKLFWCPFFSMTGTEICDIADAIGRAPDMIITNAPEEKINPKIYSYSVPIVRLPNKPTADQYFAAIPKEVNLLITLHGWLRIVPPEVCDAYAGQIYNGHPALVDLYPELKGFNQQEKILDHDQYPLIGSIIHEVTAGVDEGKVLYSCRMPNTVTSIDDAYLALRKTSLQTWEIFFAYFLNNLPIIPMQWMYTSK